MMTLTADIIGDYNIEHSNRHQFINYPRFKGFVETSFREFKDGGSSYIAILGASRDVLAQIDKNRSKLPLFRVFHDSSLSTLILKFIGTKHEIAKNELLVEFIENAQQTGITRFDLFAIGSGRKDSADTTRAKEPDEAFRPKKYQETRN